MKILAFSASNNRISINKTLALYAASLIPHAQVETVDIIDYEMPIFSDDREKELGSPELAQQFFKKISDADALIISFAEHNGSYTAAYKNLFDWISRIDKKVFQQKPAIFLSTSPGAGAARNVLEAAVKSAPYFAADLKANVSIPSFHDNFDSNSQTITNTHLLNALTKAVNLLT